MREELIKSAESFLSSANVQSADKEKKIQFLKKKGLNDEEIEEAFQRVGDNNTITTSTPITITTTTAPVHNLTPPLPPRPSNITQIVYYPPPPIPRMTSQQLLKYVLFIGFGAFGMTVALTTIIKKIMSKILNKIANYQSDRYQQNARLLKRSEETISEFTTAQDNSLQTEQLKLNDSLDRLVEFAQKIKQRETPYKGLKSNVERFRNTILQNPYTSNQFDYTSGMSTSFANRYQTENNRSAAIQNIKSEIRSFKGMLLSRRNFPVVSAAPPVIPPSVIPKAPVTPGAFNPVDENAHHPRRKRNYRNELAAQASNKENNVSSTTTTTTTPLSQSTTIEEVKETN